MVKIHKKAKLDGKSLAFLLFVSDFGFWMLDKKLSIQITTRNEIINREAGKLSVNIKLASVLKQYGDNTVIPDLNLDIKNGELFTLLGPSGCGKTTLLRMIAGFNTIEGGTIQFNDKVINSMEPGKRNIGMVFQNYAIFPNMSVRNNVAFGLKQKKVEKGSREQMVQKYLELVHVDQYADRMPDKLSGGQQQRVALARALVIHPDVLLMDEPLSNLDAKLRVEMRTVIKQIQKDVGITTVYVTHDQEEAMAISDRIAVMKDGVIRHCGKPQNIYQRPADLFVATFIGKSNLLSARLHMEDVPMVIFPNGYEVEIKNIRQEERYERAVTVSARPEELLVHKAKPEGKKAIKGVVKDSMFLGLNTHYYVELETGEKVDIIQESRIDAILEAGSEVWLTMNAEKINIFDTESTFSLMEGVVSNVEMPKEGANEEVD